MTERSGRFIAGRLTHLPSEAAPERVALLAGGKRKPSGVHAGFAAPGSQRRGDGRPGAGGGEAARGCGRLPALLPVRQHLDDRLGEGGGGARDPPSGARLLELLRERAPGDGDRGDASPGRVEKPRAESEVPLEPLRRDRGEQVHARVEV